MKLVFLMTIILASFVSLGQQKKRIKLKRGGWIGELSLNNQDILPFNLVIAKSKGNYTFTVENGEEMIKLNDPVFKNDSLYVRFPFFDSELVFSVKNKKLLEGYWVNYHKGPHYKIPFKSEKLKAPRFNMDAANNTAENLNVDGKWKVVFGHNTKSSYPAVGVFNQEEGKEEVSGTFLTETGDYRFLDGNFVGNKLYLSCFDGSHAFLFKATLDGDSLHGKFLSGSHWTSEWMGVRNENFELKSPDELTYIVDNKQVEISLKDLNGNEFNYPNERYNNKVTIIQIMGSWCPNCLDETHYYKELYEKYHEQGLEIISIGYETGSDFNTHASNIRRFKDNLELDFQFLVGGQASKGLASEHFSMLNKIISFPTSIFIGRDGMVKRVHTGFNGPGTGKYYQEYVENTNSLIESLLAD